MSSKEFNEKSNQFIATNFSDKQWSFTVPEEIDKMTDLEKMKIIRIRKRQNQEKVRKFFGSDLRIDVPLKMINQLGLPAMLESDLPLTYFICFLIKYQGIENLVFCLEVEKFKDTKFDTFETKKSFAQRIFNGYMENGIPMQINTNKKNIEDARDKLANCKTLTDFDEIFCPAFIDIYSMLLNVYADFERSDFYTQMMTDLTTGDAADKAHDSLLIDSKCGSGSIYPMKAYYSALDSITYTVGCMERIFDERIASKRVSINRHRIIRRMIVSFCEQRLKMDFPESTLNLRQSLLTDPEETSASTVNQRSSIISNISAMSNISQSNSSNASVIGKRKDELDLF